MNSRNVFLGFLLALSSLSFAASPDASSRVVPKKEGGCYQISSVKELYGFVDVVNGDGTAKDSTACGVLKADITLDDSWRPMEVFSGTFDGKGHTISNLKGDSKYFFDTVSGTEKNPAVIKNTGWVNGSLTTTGAGTVGLILTASGYVELDHLFSDLNYTAPSGKISCFVVYQSGHLTISNSYNTGSISYSYSDKDGIGIFVAKSLGVVTLKNVYNLGGSAAFVGEVLDSLIVKNAYSLGIGVPFYCVANRASYAKAVIKSNFFVTARCRDATDVVSEDEFWDGSVALRLHYMYDGEIWGQNVGVDDSPIFSGVVANDLSSTVKVSKINYVTFKGDTTSYPKTYLEGVSKFVAYEPTARAGYVFGGWFEHPDGAGSPIDSISAYSTGDKTIYGKWWKIPSPKNGCYEIGSMEDLFGFAAVVNGAPGVVKDSTACGKLVADIKYETESDYYAFQELWWEPIQNFAGRFDGNGHTISNLKTYKRGYNEADADPAGLFGSVSGGSAENPVVIKNLKVYKCSLVSSWGSGSIVGRVKDSSYVSLDSLIAEHSYVGGIRSGGIIGAIGKSSTVSLTNSQRIESTSGDYNVGGLVGDVGKGSHLSLMNCAVKGYVGANNNGVGSIVGSIAEEAAVVINQVSADGDVEGNSYIGGFVGDNEGNLRIINSYHAGDIIISSCIEAAGDFSGNVAGGFVGVDHGDMYIINSFQFGSFINERIKTSAVNCKLTSGAFAGYLKDDKLHADNVFYSSSLPENSVGYAADDSLFVNGNIANKLHEYDRSGINGNIWGQKIGEDEHPVFTSKIEGYDESRKYARYFLHYDGEVEEHLYLEGSVTQLPFEYDTVSTIFYGWYRNNEFTGDTTLHIDETDSGTLHFYATYVSRSYNVTFNIHKGDSCGGKVYAGYDLVDSVVSIGFNGTSMRVYPDSGCKVDESYGTIKEGYQVIGFFSKDTTIDVYFTKAVYAITYHSDVNDSSFLSGADSVYTYWDEVTLASPTDECYTFDGWYGNKLLRGQTYTKIEKGTMGDKEYWAKWTQKDECKSSSSVAAESSSSVESSSSSEKTVYFAEVAAPKFSVGVVDRQINLDGIRAGSRVTLMDALGRIITRQVASGESVHITAPYSGRFVVHANGATAVVSVR